MLDPNIANTPRFERKTPSARRRQLIEAAIRCLEQGGMSAFTIDRICQEAGVSRGLVNYHFEGKKGLLVCVYEAMTAYLPQAGRPQPGANSTPPEARLCEIIERSFEQKTFDKSQLRAWLAVWGEVASDPALQTLHRSRYSAYKSALTGTMAAIAAERKLRVDCDTLAGLLIALIDGLWLEHCLDSGVLPVHSARSSCYALLEAHLGVFDR